MASGPIVEEGGDGAREKQRFTESKVYTRKAFKGPKKNNSINNNSANANANANANSNLKANAYSNANSITAVATAKDTETPVPTSNATDTTNPIATSNATDTATPIATSKATDTATPIATSNATDTATPIDTETPITTSNATDTATPIATSNAADTSNNTNETNENNKDNGKNKDNGNSNNENLTQPPAQALPLPSEDGNSTQPPVQALSLPSEDGNSTQPPVQALSLPSEDGNSTQQRLNSRLDTASEDSSSLNRQQQVSVAPASNARDPPSGNGPEKPSSENRVKIALASKSKQEMRELRRKLESELETVRSLVKRIEAKQGQVGGYSHSHVSPRDLVNNGGSKRVHSEVASVGVSREMTRPLHQLSISVLENSHGVSDNVEKEKRTPKANQFYRNSEFLLGKDKFPPAESNKKSKLSVKKHGGGDMGNGFGMGTKFFKSCGSLLEKLMKHKHGWVFNEPVDAERLGLHDYHIIIKNPMDFGTIKTRLNKNWYKSPKEFAEDVRLTLRNAMTYNPIGQDVHIMAEQLSKIFEERWAIIESDYNREMRFGFDYGVGLSTPTSRKAPLLPPPLDMRRILDRSESMTHPHDPRLKPMSVTPTARTPALKKPKAKDPHKRDMTYEEKQKLSTNLQSLPSEKLDAIVQIIKKRNSQLFQHDDEIEVDIDSVDAETLWELDRFVTNYKKSLSKNKRKAELAMQARQEAVQNLQEKIQPQVVPEVPKESKTADDKIVSSLSPVRGDNEGDNRSRSSSSSSSSSDSGSSSSDSDSDSSSASGSDAGSPRS